MSTSANLRDIFAGRSVPIIKPVNKKPLVTRCRGCGRLLPRIDYERHGCAECGGVR